MKKTIFTVAIAAAVATSSFTGCNTPEQKVEKAETKLEDAKQDLKDVLKDSLVAAQKAATAEDWKMFKNEAEATIKNNDLKIGNLKKKMKKPVSQNDLVYTNSINALEQQNHNLTVKIDNYDKSHSDWESFKREFNHDAEEFAKAFKNVTVNNIK